MATVLDTAILVGKESAYGTPATLTRAFEGHADTFKREHEYLVSKGFRAGYHTEPADRRTAINMGGTGSIEVDVLNKGMGLLLQGTLGTTAGPTQEGATAAYTSTFTSAADDPAVSFTIQTQRSDITGTLRKFTHHGCVITGWSLKNSVGDLLMANFDFDFEDSDTTTATAAPSYPASAAPFNWTQGVVTVSGVATDVNSFELTADLGLKTDRRYVKGSALKEQPVRAKQPVFEGSLEVDYADDTLYNLFVAGTTVEVIATWTGSQIESPYNHELKVTLPAVQFTGESPQAELEDVTKQAVPFKVLYDGTNAAVTIEYTSTDTSL